MRLNKTKFDIKRHYKYHKKLLTELYRVYDYEITDSVLRVYYRRDDERCMVEYTVNDEMHLYERTHVL